MGPAGMSGRITAIDVNLNNTDEIFIGSASGGVWHSLNAGTTWLPIFDKEQTLSIGSVAIDQSNPDVIWVGTGEGNPRNSLNVGNGIYRSLDHGKTWKCMGLEKTKVIHRIKINPQNSNIIYAATMGSPWGESDDRGIFKTIDGGKHWEKILYVNNLTGAADLVMDPENPNKLLVAMWQHKRTPWDFVSGGEGSDLYLTYDGGNSWKKLTEKEGLPKGELGRIGVAIAQSNRNVIYALIEAKENGLYKSEDGGENWKLVSSKNIGNRPFYYSEIYVDPLNENRLYNLWSFVSVSEDGGKTFETIMNYGNNVHPDNHAFWIHPHNSSYMINGNDGGLNITHDGGKNWTYMTNLPVGQFYHINVDNDFPFNIYGGMQDNGSWVGPSAVLKRGGIRNYDWSELYFGDGFDVVPNVKDNRYGYAMSQGGNVVYYDRLTGRNRFVKPVEDDSIPLRFNWNAAIAQDPYRECGVYFGSQYLHYSQDCGRSWEKLSGDLTSNDTTKQHQDISGGLTIDATNAENYTTIISIAPSPLDENIVWVGTDDGNLQLTLDKGKTWKNLSTNMQGLPKGSWMAQVTPSSFDKNSAVVVVNNYRRNDFKPYLFSTHDGGKTWKNLVANAGIESFTLSFVQDYLNKNLMLLGTDQGLYVSFDAGEHWQLWNEGGLPRVQISDMVIQKDADALVVGTFGRSIYVLDNLKVLRAIAQNKMVLNEKMAILTDEISGKKLSIKPVDGIRFVAQGDFIGENRSFQPSIPIWIKPEGDTMKNVKVKAKIIDTHEDTIRTFTAELSKGLNFINWNMCVDGVRYPGSKKLKKDEDLPSGYQVLAGRYEAQISLDTIVRKCHITVLDDERFQDENMQYMAQRNAWINLYQTINQATEHYDHLDDMMENITLIESWFTFNQDSIPKEWKEKHKQLKKEINELKALYKMPDDVKGIQRNPENVMSKIGVAQSYIWYPDVLAYNPQLAISEAQVEADRVDKKVDAFIDTKWKDYSEEVEKMKFGLIKSLKKN
ncbi:MAG: hypothetical protein R2766_08380 [Saprospiraceae bacterium]